MPSLFGYGIGFARINPMTNLSNSFDVAFFFLKGIAGKCFGFIAGPRNQTVFSQPRIVPTERPQEGLAQHTIISGTRGDWQPQTIEKMIRGEQIVLENCALESVAVLCFRHN